MVKAVSRFADRTGTAHHTPRDAAVADLTSVIYGTTCGAGVASSIAKVIIDQRAEIEIILGELDAAEADIAAEAVRVFRARARA